MNVVATNVEPTLAVKASSPSLARLKTVGHLLLKRGQFALFSLDRLLEGRELKIPRCAKQHSANSANDRDLDIPLLSRENIRAGCHQLPPVVAGASLGTGGANSAFN